MNKNSKYLKKALEETVYKIGSYTEEELKAKLKEHEDSNIAQSINQFSENNMEFNIGDEVVVADNSRNTYRSDVYKATIVDIVRTPKRVKYHLSDNTAVTNENRMYKLSKD